MRRPINPQTHTHTTRDPRTLGASICHPKWRFDSPDIAHLIVVVDVKIRKPGATQNHKYILTHFFGIRPSTKLTPLKLFDAVSQHNNIPQTFVK